jgi:hypothetical protein
MPFFIRAHQITCAISTLILCLCATTAQAQSYRVLNNSGNGEPFTVSLAPSDQGKDIIVISETSKASAQALTAKIAGLAGLSARLYGRVVDSQTSIDTFDINPYLTPLEIRDSKGSLITSIEIPPASPGDDGSGDGDTGAPDSRPCLVRHAGPELESDLNIYRIAFPWVQSDEDLCNIIYPRDSDGVSGGGSNPDPLMASGTAFVFRSACTANQKVVAITRISTAGLLPTDFDGTKSFTLSVSLKSEDRAADFWRLKIAEGFEKGATYFLSPTLNEVRSATRKYGVSGTDIVFIQEYNRSGDVLSTAMRKTRQLDGSVDYNISKKVGVFMRKKRGRTTTFTTVSYKLGKAYSQCIPPGSMNRCTAAYSRRHGITVCGRR